MIRLTGIYPSAQGATFDWDYYMTKHLPLFRERLREAGIETMRVERGVAGLAPGAPPAALCVFQATIRDGERFAALMAQHAPELLADVPRFTNVQPSVQLGEAVAEEPTGVRALVAEARASVEPLSPAEAARWASEGAVVVDLREPAERAQHGAIPGAVHAPRGMLEFHADPASPYHLKELEPARPVVLYCASGGRSALAGAALRRLGYARVSHLDGGLAAWVKEGRPLEQAPR